jgi:hypothetical protein
MAATDSQLKLKALPINFVSLLIVPEPFTAAFGGFKLVESPTIPNPLDDI